MEARDACGTEGSVEEDGTKSGISSVMAALAKDAAFLFQSRRFSECVGVLNQILQKKEDDPKVLHNIALAEYFQDNCADPKRLFELLKKVKRGSEELARTSRVQRENSITNVNSGSRESGSTDANADVLDTSIVTLNMALILYHLHEYALSLSLLEPLYQNIEPIDETTALHVCLLLLDVALASKDASRSADVIQYLERAFGVGYMLNQEDVGVIPQHSSSNQTIKSSMTSTGFATSDVTGSDSSIVVNTSESLPAGTLPDDVIEYENLLSTLDNSRGNMKKQVQSEILRTSANVTVSAIDLKLKLQLYKVHFFLLTRNLKAAKREIKIAMNNPRGKESSKAFLLKAQLEYARGNHRKAIKLLGNRTEMEFSSMISNNLACIYHQLKKHHSSTMFFAKALKSNVSVLGEKPFSLHTLGQMKSLFIVYNCGLEHMLCGRPLEAAHCFYKTSPIFCKQPLIWLRLAECCLLAKEKGLLKMNGTSSSNAEEARVNVIGSGRFRHLSIDPNSRRSLDTLAVDGSITNDGRCKLSIPLARTCLINAMHLLNVTELKVLKADAHDTATEDVTKSFNALALENQETRGGHGSNAIFSNSVSSYNIMLDEKKHMVRQAVLASLAYVELCLENHLKALSAARTLLQLHDCSEMYLFLGRIYAAEALCHLNRPKEASEFLSIYVSNGGTMILPFSDENIEKWCTEKGLDHEDSKTFPKESHNARFFSPKEAQGLLHVNLASIFAMQGKLDEAAQSITKGISIIPNNPRALLAAVYIDLLLGKTQDAIRKLKCYNGVKFC